MACVYREMAMREKELEGVEFDTLYIGGGTPSVIDENYIVIFRGVAPRTAIVTAHTYIICTL